MPHSNMRPKTPDIEKLYSSKMILSRGDRSGSSKDRSADAGNQAVINAINSLRSEIGYLQSNQAELVAFVKREFEIIRIRQVNLENILLRTLRNPKSADHESSAGNGEVSNNRVQPTTDSASAQQIEVKNTSNKIQSLEIANLSEGADLRLPKDNLIFKVKHWLAAGMQHDILTRQLQQDAVNSGENDRIWICMFGGVRDVTWSISVAWHLHFQINDNWLALFGLLKPAQLSAEQKAEIILNAKTGTKKSESAITLTYRGLNQTELESMVKIVVDVISGKDSQDLSEECRNIHQRVETLRKRKMGCIMGKDFSHYGAQFVEVFIDLKILNRMVLIFEAVN